MWHRHCAHSKAHILSCFLVGQDSGGTKRTGQPSWVPPCACGLEQWTVERMRYLKEVQSKAPKEKLDLPAGWLTAMNHMFHTAQRVAVRSIAARYASTWDVQSWYMSQTAGPRLCFGSTADKVGRESVLRCRRLSSALAQFLFCFKVHVRSHFSGTFLRSG